MAKITELSASYSRTVQLKPFEPIKINFGGTISIEEGDDPNEELTKLYMNLRKRVHEMFIIDFKAHGIDLNRM